MTREAKIGPAKGARRDAISVYLVDDVPELRELVKYGWRTTRTSR